MSDVLNRKVGCATEFARLVLEGLRGRVFRIVLFGSVAKGVADADSDVDVLLIVDSVTEEVRNIVAEAAFQASLRHGESMEYVIMSIEEYRSRGLDNPLIYEVEKWGEILYENPEVEKRRAAKLLELAEEYYGYAERCKQNLMYRAAIDLGQNTVELLLKASILAKGEPLPRTRGGYVHRFGELYVLIGEVSRDIVPKLYRVLELRNRARYDPDYTPTEVDVDEVLQLYRELRDMVRRLIGLEERSTT